MAKLGGMDDKVGQEWMTKLGGMNDKVGRDG